MITIEFLVDKMIKAEKSYRDADEVGEPLETFSLGYWWAFEDLFEYATRDDYFFNGEYWGA